jgi:hypothetical protein
MKQKNEEDNKKTVVLDATHNCVDALGTLWEAITNVASAFSTVNELLTSNKDNESKKIG